MELLIAIWARPLCVAGLHLRLWFRIALRPRSLCVAGLRFCGGTGGSRRGWRGTRRHPPGRTATPLPHLGHRKSSEAPDHSAWPGVSADCRWRRIGAPDSFGFRISLWCLRGFGFRVWWVRGRSSALAFHQYQRPAVVVYRSHTSVAWAIGSRLGCPTAPRGRASQPTAGGNGFVPVALGFGFDACADVVRQLTRQPQHAETPGPRTEVAPCRGARSARSLFEARSRHL